MTLKAFINTDNIIGAIKCVIRAIKVYGYHCVNIWAVGVVSL